MVEKLNTNLNTVSDAAFEDIKAILLSNTIATGKVDRIIEQMKTKASDKNSLIISTNKLITRLLTRAIGKKMMSSHGIKTLIQVNYDLRESVLAHVRDEMSNPHYQHAQHGNRNDMDYIDLIEGLKENVDILSSDVVDVDTDRVKANAALDIMLAILILDTDKYTVAIDEAHQTIDVESEDSRIVTTVALNSGQFDTFKAMVYIEEFETLKPLFKKTFEVLQKKP